MQQLRSLNTRVAPTSWPHLLHLLSLHISLPQLLYGLLSGRLSIFTGPIQWSLKGLHIRPFGHQFKSIWFFFSYFYTLEWPSFLKSSIAFPNLLFCWHPQPQPPRDLFLLFINSKLITIDIVCTTLSYQCEATSGYFIWPHVSWLTKSLINSHPFPLEKHTFHVIFSSCRNRGTIAGSWSQEKRQNMNPGKLTQKLLTTRLYRI